MSLGLREKRAFFRGADDESQPKGSQPIEESLQLDPKLA